MVVIMKNIVLLLISFIGITSCTSRHTTGEDESSSSTGISKQVLLSDKALMNKDVIGVWWDANDKDASCATFMITESTIIYPDQEGKSDYKYKVNNDSLIIYFEGYNSSSKIEKLRNDTLILITDNNKMTFYKTKE